MPIKYALFENNITSDPDDYAAIVRISGSADGDDLVQDIVDQGSTVNKPDILAVTAALKLACQRRAIRLGIADCGFRIDERCEPSGCRGAGSAIRNRQSAIRNPQSTWSGPEWAAAHRPANCVSDVWTLS